jgi:protein-tyrosine-phosphatase
MTTQVIFACVHNAGRSQMAAAFFNRVAAAGRAHAVSAGTKPANEVQPEVIAVMREVGIDLRGARPRRFTEARGRQSTPRYDGVRGGVPGRAWTHTRRLAHRRPEGPAA